MDAPPRPQSIDPERVFQLVVQLAEKTQKLAERDALVDDLTKELNALRAEHATVSTECEMLRKDVDTLPKIVERGESYRSKWKALKEKFAEDTAKHQRQLDELRHAAEDVAKENDSLRDTVKQSTAKWVAQHEASERTAVTLRNEACALQQEIAKMTVKWDHERREWQQQLADMHRKQSEVRQQRVSVSVSASPDVVSSYGQTESACSAMVNKAVQVRVEDDEGSLDEWGPAGPASRRARLRSQEDAALERARHMSASSQFRAKSVLEPSALQYALLTSSDEAMTKMINDGEVLHRRQIERQIKIHDRLLATVASLQREAFQAPAAPPLFF